jgi:NTE family protein
LARVVTSRLIELSTSPDILEAFSRRTDRLPRSIAVLTAGGGADVRRTRDVVLDALSTSRATTRLSVREAREAMSPGFTSPSDLVVFECEPSATSWLDFSLRQADRILVVLDDEECRRSGREAEVWRDAKLGERAAQVELAIVHPPSAELPRAGAGYGRLPGVARVHHVRGVNRPDAEGLARWLLDRPVGLVLGGGGAYGIAHVGVLKALEEARVPVDVVGGTSMGAIFAGGMARGWSADRLMEEVRSLFASRFALYDFTLPVTSLLGGKKLERVLEGLFGDLAIADLWLPFFCVATDISRARSKVHEDGPLRDAIRSSCSIPGLFPPYHGRQQSLVDGGLVDNLPLDVMGQRCRGPIIAVDALPYQRRRDGDGDGKRSRGWLDRALQRLKPSALPLFDILMRATFVGSQHTTEMSLASHPPALYLVPRLERFRILEWRAYQAIFEAGYACAKRELDAGALPRSLWEGRVEDARA